MPKFTPEIIAVASGTTVASQKGLPWFEALPIRIREKILVNENGCWVWMAFKYDGYGRLRFNGFETRQAHRIVYQLVKGLIPDSLTIDHLCRNRSCVNPDHLEPVPLEENLRRGTGVGVKNAAKTHCKRGHDLSEGNYYAYKGKRFCKKCQVIRQQECEQRKVRRAA